MFKVKILMLGPCKSGKTTIANFLSEATETSGGDYHPTQGCRILEFENNVQVNGRNVNAEVELWDVSGDQKFEGCWPTIAKDSSGIVFVANPDEPNHDKQLEVWHGYFLPLSRLMPDQCLVMVHKKPDKTGQTVAMPETMSKITVVHTSIEDDGESLRQEFTNYLTSLLTTMSDKREQEELGILNSR